MKVWYALYCKPNAEYRVVSGLQQRGVETFLPEVEVVHADRRWKEPFFPCYLFCRFDLVTMSLRDICWIPGLRRIVAFDERPVPVPDEVIDLIRYELGEVDGGDVHPSDFLPGDIVRITQGPFKDLLAIFDGAVSSSKRVQVLLKVLGGPSRVQVEVDNLEKAHSHPKLAKHKRGRRTRGKGRRIRSKA